MINKSAGISLSFSTLMISPSTMCFHALNVNCLWLMSYTCDCELLQDESYKYFLQFYIPVRNKDITCTTTNAAYDVSGATGVIDGIENSIAHIKKKILK